MYPIFFYIPKKNIDLEIIEVTDDYVLGAEVFLNTSLAWSLQTYLHLRKRKIDCQLTNKIPEKGILLCTFQDIDFNFKPTKDLFFCLIRADGYYFPYANSYVVQNKIQVSENENSFFISHWPQPLLQKRESIRNLTFENVKFFGYEVNLAKELQTKEWESFLKEHNLSWHLVGCNASDHEKIDYSETDLIIAIREFNLEKTSFSNKPASKLYNSWIAEIPFIGGNESAYLMEKTNDFDCIIVNNLEELKEKIIFLKDNPKVRQKMIDNAIIKSQLYDTDKITDEWIDTLNKVLKLAEEWRKLSNFKRKLFFIKKFFLLKKRGLFYRLNQILN